ncbi:hypothetical protein PLANPX_3881 [Lacipirellula parvula]|uniref:Uncharacterized protein n=1 Tax=Lacipirellula parvula TaxID=2650471 RepID=A0A5K7XMI7_9BACT|nr:hypothetical protein PLANPX_3881 [Lacipirellula parvula]
MAAVTSLYQLLHSRSKAKGLSFGWKHPLPEPASLKPLAASIAH